MTDDGKAAVAVAEKVAGPPACGGEQGIQTPEAVVTGMTMGATMEMMVRMVRMTVRKMMRVRARINHRGVGFQDSTARFNSFRW